jgi:hypothetical protein
VSQFAAGCSVCGFDVERLRHGRRARLRSSFRIPELSEGVLLTLLMVTVAVFAPLFGMALAALVFFDRWRRGHRPMGYVAAAAFVLAVIAFLI